MFYPLADPNWFMLNLALFVKPVKGEPPVCGIRRKTFLYLVCLWIRISPFVCGLEFLPLSPSIHFYYGPSVIFPPMTNLVTL